MRTPVNRRRAIRTTNLLERLFLEERRRLKIIPNAFGEKPILKLMFGAMIGAAERWRPIKVTDFERRQMAAVRQELDQEYKAHTGLDQQTSKEAPPTQFPASLGLDDLRKGWRPEQIAGRLKRQGASDYACHETIYRYVYSRRGVRKKLFTCLFLAKPRRTGRTTRRHRKGKFLYVTPIAERPESVNLRAVFGHWEADSLLFLPSFHATNLTTLVERQTRFAIALKQDNRQSNPVMTAIRTAMERLPLSATQTITFDKGSEFAHFMTIERQRKRQRRKIKTYYCQPRSPWQKGGVENFNKRLRRYLPKDRDIRNLKQHAISVSVRP